MDVDDKSRQLKTPLLEKKELEEKDEGGKVTYTGSVSAGDGDGEEKPKPSQGSGDLKELEEKDLVSDENGGAKGTSIGSVSAGDEVEKPKPPQGSGDLKELEEKDLVSDENGGGKGTSTGSVSAADGEEKPKPPQGSGNLEIDEEEAKQTSMTARNGDEKSPQKPPQGSGDFEIEEEEKSKHTYPSSSSKAQSTARNEDEKSPQKPPKVKEKGGELVSQVKSVPDIRCDQEGSQVEQSDLQSLGDASHLPESRQPPSQMAINIDDASHNSPLPEEEEVIDIQGENEKFTITGKLIIRRRRLVQQITSENRDGEQPTNRDGVVIWLYSWVWKYLMALWTAFILYVSPIQFSFYFASSIRSPVISRLDWLITLIGSADVLLTLYVGKRRGTVWTWGNISFGVCDFIGYIPWIFICRMVTPVKINETWQDIPILLWMQYLFRSLIWMRMFRVRVVHNVVQELKNSWASMPRLEMAILITEFVGLSFLLTHMEGALAFYFQNIQANPIEDIESAKSHIFFPSIYFAFVTLSGLSYCDIGNDLVMVFGLLSFHWHLVFNSYWTLKQNGLAKKFETFIN